MSDSPNLVIIQKHQDDAGARVTGLDKFLISIIITIVFLIMSLPLVFKLTNKGTRLLGVKAVTDAGVPTVVGVIIHALIFFIVIRLLMQ